MEDAAALRLPLEGAIERLSAQVSRQAPDESVAAIRSENEALRVAVMRRDLTRAALLREITGLTRAFASAGEAMVVLGKDLSAAPSPDVVPLARLEARPVLLAGSLPTLARGLTSVQSGDGLLARLAGGADP